MGLFANIFNTKKYNPKASIYKMDTLEDIKKIPVPASNFEYNCDFTKSIEYVLQRRATQFKKEGNLDLAIACLKKAIEIIPFAPMQYTDVYIRLENYLKLAGKFDEVREVNVKQGDIKQNQEEQLYNRMLESSSLADLIEVPRETRVCSECARYHGRVYSKKKNSKFPQMALFVNYYNTKHCDCPPLTFYPFWENASIPTICSQNKLIEYSNRPFEDDRTRAEKKNYEDYIAQIKTDIKDRKDYDWLCEHLPDNAPKSYGGYRNMKNKNSINYQKLVSLAKENGYTI